VKRNVRENLITTAEADATFQRFKGDEASGVWAWFPIELPPVEMACARVEAASDSTFLRAADALHLACAEEQGFTEIHTHERHVLTAAAIFGLQGKDAIVMG